MGRVCDPFGYHAWGLLEMAIGETSLAEAREAAVALRRRLPEGFDPVAGRRMAGKAMPRFNSAQTEFGARNPGIQVDAFCPECPGSA